MLRHPFIVPIIAAWLNLADIVEKSWFSAGPPASLLASAPPRLPVAASAPLRPPLTARHLAATSASTVAP
ncbi:hypothetical protein GUJ93_ZPchr0005g15721 [Zizania palustris]|uniref:Uncharacterized protein n=1 Tax=Zizania palustris TaxID=103762 RepID=A0A8J5SH04_ZIZPA|nr:hypothetical protein GUJ93_ZPchr0005g15721 [Zizania palustris]